MTSNLENRKDKAVLDLLKDRMARRREELASRGSGRKLAAALAAFAPPFEIVEAAGLDAVRLVAGGDSGAETRGLKHLKNEACSLLKGVFGSLPASGLMPDAVIVGGACDQLRRSAEIFRRDFGLPVFELAVPRVNALPQSKERMKAELLWLCSELAAFAGRARPTEAQIESRMRAWNQARRRCNELAIARAHGRIGAAAASAVARSIWTLGAEEFCDMWVKIAEMLPERTGATMLRIVLAGPPVLEGDDILCNALDHAKTAVVAADLCETMCHPHQREIFGEGDLMSALAAAANSFPLGCGFKRPDSGFVQALRSAVGAAHADGVILKGLSFCAPWNHQHSRLCELAGAPTLALEGDFAEGQESRIRTRVEAFLESLIMKNRKCI